MTDLKKSPAVVTRDLLYPLELKNAAGDVTETIATLQLKRLNGKDMRDIANATEKGAGTAMALLVCRSAGIPPSTFDMLDAEDVAELGIITSGFIGGALPTGVT